MRLLPASISARLLIAMFGSILAAQLVGAVVLYYDRPIQAARWSAIGWSVRIIDLVRMLDTMNAPERKLALQAIGDKSVGEQPSVRRASANQNTDAEFMRFFRHRVAQLRPGNNAITIGPSVAEVVPDIELNTLSEFPAKGSPLFYDVRIPFTDGPSLTLRLRDVDRAIPAP